MKMMILALAILASTPAFAQMSDTEKAVRRTNQLYDAVPTDWCDPSTTAMIRETELAIVRRQVQELSSMSKEEYQRRASLLEVCSDKIAQKETIVYSRLSDMIPVAPIAQKEVEVLLKEYQNVVYFHEDINVALTIYWDQIKAIRLRELVGRYDALVERYNELGNRLARADNSDLHIRTSHQHYLALADSSPQHSGRSGSEDRSQPPPRA